MATAAVPSTTTMLDNAHVSLYLNSVPDESPTVFLNSSAYSVPQRLIGRKSCFEGVEEFRGIPYGTVHARWQHSELRKSLPDDIFYATENGSQCPQPSIFANSNVYQSHLDWPEDVGESEFDCLNLFIVRPSPAALSAAGFDTEKKVPVYFYIHGGGFGFGASTDPIWDPSRLVARGLAIGQPFMTVSINYRLGIFGFAASSDILAAQRERNDRLKGCNFGLGDQRTALEWVSQNISAFGGDPADITIGGQSAGGISVHAHILEAKFGSGPPIVRNAIGQSGGFGTLGPLPMVEHDKMWGELCEELLAKSQDLMSTISATELLEANVRKGRFVFPLVKDDLTIRDRPNGRWSVHLARRGGERSGSPQQPLFVLLGDTEDECAVWDSQAKKIKDLEHLRTIFQASGSSNSAIDEIFSAFGFMQGISEATFYERISKFLTDVQFGRPVQCARDEFSSNAADQKRFDGSQARPTSIRSFRMKVGNPFPGSFEKIATHCVDLIYIFDCFHDDLVKADHDLSESGAATNLDLVQKIQSQWIDFITKESKAGQENEVKVYEQDRREYTVDMNSDDDFKQRGRRFALLSKNWKECLSALDLIKTGI